MQYISTREGRTPVSAARAILQGLSGEGGLFVPSSFPVLRPDTIHSFRAMSYDERATEVLAPFLTEFSRAGIQSMCAAAYARFDSPSVTPVHSLNDRTHMLELWHGPTHAFKDVALQLLPRLMSESKKALGETSETLILVATSGDTGKAALEGFCDAPGVRVCVFYPKGGVSEVQRLQMVTQAGANTRAVAVRGNFDDAQTGVKRIFTDPALAKSLAKSNIALSSANSINLGRLLPQIAYYFSAYADLVGSSAIRPGDEINVCVPTGNFGNILAAVYAKKMGLPIQKLICASNENNVLTDFINTGVYDRNRAFHLTSSPSMDILISSNLERLLFELAGRDAGQIVAWMDELKSTGRYRLLGGAFSELQFLLWGGFARETDVAGEIKRVWAEHRYLIDPHTAVASHVLSDYRAQTGDNTPVLIASTASPYKFGRAVADALFPDEALGLDDFECCALIEDRTGTPMPDSIRTLRQLPIYHTAECDIGDMANQIFLIYTT